jgi:hypothetical protein
MLQGRPTRSAPRRVIGDYMILGGSSELSGYTGDPAWGLGRCADGCGCGPCSWRSLGAITADQAAAQAMPKNTIRNKAGFTQAVYDEIVNAARTGQFNDYNAQATSCVTGPSTTGQQVLSLTSSGAGLALTGAIQTGLIAVGPATLGISIAIAGIVGIFGTIFSHHAAAIAKERRILCASGPAANNYLQIIDQAVQMGKATPAQAKQALQSLLADYTSTVQPIIKNNSGQCNAACVELKELTAIVAYKSSVYDDMANAAPVSSSSGAGPTSAPAVSSGSTLQIPPASAASAGVAPAAPRWLPIAALIALGIFASRVI